MLPASFAVFTLPKNGACRDRKLWTKASQQTRLSGLGLVGLVGNEKYGCDRSTDGMGSGREAGNTRAK